MELTDKLNRDYCSMEYLDVLLAQPMQAVENEDTTLRTEEATKYYNLLQQIKSLQESGAAVPDNLYEGLDSFQRFVCGYYIANFHYNLCMNMGNIDEIETKLLRFIKACTKEELKQFYQEAWSDIIYYINYHKVGVPEDITGYNFIDQAKLNASVKETEILQLVEAVQ